MARYRSREAETEDVNQRRLQRGAVKRQHLARWAVGYDELAPGVIGPGHLQPTVIETIRDNVAGSGVGQLLVVSATAQSFASGGAYVTADSIVYQHGFDRVTAAGDSIVWPVDAVGEVQVEFTWDTYEGGGTIEIEVDGTVPAWGTLAVGSAGQEGRGSRLVHIAEGSVVKVKVTQPSGVAKTGDVHVEFSIPDPSLSMPSGAYAALVLSDGPIAYWRLDETSGTVAADHTGNGYDAVYAGTYVLGASGVMGDGSASPALDASGTGASGVTGADWADLEFAGVLPYSVECWFRPATIGAGNYILVQKQGDLAGPGWELVIVGLDDRVVFTRGSGAGASVTSAASSVATGVDYYAVVTFDGTTQRLYLDGVEVDDAISPGTMGTNSVTLSIGYDSASGVSGFDGVIDEVAIYDRPLSAGEIAEHYAVGSSG